MLFLRDFLPETGPASAAAAYIAGLAAAGFWGTGMPPSVAFAAGAISAGLGAAAFFHFGRRRQQNPGMREEDAERLGFFLGCVLLALWFGLGFLRMSRALWPGEGMPLPEGFSVAGGAVVEESKAIAPGVYRGPQYQLVLRIRKPGGMDEAAVETLTEPARLWRRQRKLLLTVGFAAGREGESRAAAFGRACLAGAVIRFRGEISGEDRPGNPGEFDYARYLRTKGVYCRAEADEGDVFFEKAPSAGQRLLESLRAGFRAQAERFLDPKYAAVVSGCLLGDQSLMQREDREIYRRVGIAHLFAVSGTHGGILLSLALHLERFRPFRKRKWAGRLPALGLLFLYLSLTGFPMSMWRTFLMACAMQAAAVLGRKGDTLNALGGAALILLWFSPESLFGAGFQLSFGVTWGLLRLGPWLGKRFPPWLAAPLAAQMAAAPIQAYWFYQIQPLGFLINLWAVALMPPLLLLSGAAALTGAFSLSAAAILWQAPGFLAAVLDRSAHLWISLPFASANIGEQPWPAYLLWGLVLWALPDWKAREAALDRWLTQRYLQKKRLENWRDWETWRLAKKARMEATEKMAAMGKMDDAEPVFTDTEGDLSPVFRPGQVKPGFFRRLWHLRRPAAAACAAFFLVLRLILPGPLTIYFLDVGQGDGIFFTTPSGNHWMVDGGSSSVGRLAEYRLEPFLRSRGIARLDYVLISHVDEDHISGIRDMLSADWPIGVLLLPPQAVLAEGGRNLLALAGEKGTEVLFFSRGQKVTDGKLILRCLHPGEDAAAEGNGQAGSGQKESARKESAQKGSAQAGGNESSIVAELRYGNFSLLLTGDAGQRIEEENMHLWRRVSMLKVAHHGAGGGTGEDFLAKLTPGAAVISCGRNNMYGHPHPDTLKRLRAAGVRIYITAEHGAVRVVTDGRSFRVSTFIRP